MASQEMVVHQSGAVQHASAFMPVMTMSQAIERRNVIIEATKQLMLEGVDFGKIPNAGEKPGLFQPGADKLCNLFGLSVQYEFVEKVEDWTGSNHGGEPFFYYQVKGRAFRGDYLVGEGIGSCSSWESKYRYRKNERTCPECGTAAIIKGKAEYGGGWVCFAKKGGCGAKFRDGDAAIEAQEVGRRPNPDIADQVNTVLKMAVKRAKVAATINATSASEFFTQDIEDFPQWEHAAPAQAQPQNEQGEPKETAASNPPQKTESRPVPKHWRELDPQYPWKTRGQMARAFELLEAGFGKGDHLEYVRFLDDQGVKDPKDFREKEHAITCFQHMRRWLVSRDGEGEQAS